MSTRPLAHLIDYDIDLQSAREYVLDGHYHDAVACLDRMLGTICQAQGHELRRSGIAGFDFFHTPATATIRCRRCHLLVSGIPANVLEP